jgi:glycosyltransferase involved in cell wall biosynthesis
LLISARPLVLVTPMVWERLPLLEGMPSECARLPCHIFVALFWTYREPAPRQSLVRWYHTYAAAHPHRRLTVLANEPEIVSPLRHEGVDVELVNHNVWVDERIFRPTNDGAPEFDAVYNAKFTAWKRHELARDIGRLALVGYPDRLDSPRRAARYLRDLRKALPRATFCNDFPDGTMRRLSPVDVNGVLNRAQVGLCLSAEEGAMVASIEYLLSGLPVVSTRSHGGRDYFFDPAYCRVVEPDARLVRAAVDELTALRIPRETIRARTLARVEADRARFAARVQAAGERMGGSAPDSDGWRDRLGEFWPSRPVAAFWDRVVPAYRAGAQDASAESPSSSGRSTDSQS